MKGKNTEDLLSEINPSPREQALAQQVKDLQAHLKKVEKQSGQDDILIDAVQDAIVTLPKPKMVALPKTSVKKVDSEALVAWTDWHSEEYVDMEEMEGFAQYDWDTFLDRVWATCEKTVLMAKIMRESWNVNNITIAALGDMLTGKIHFELDRTNTFDLPVAVVNVAHILAQAVNMIASNFDKVTFVGVSGNHGRMDDKPTAKSRADRNWDTAVYRIASLLTKATPNIEWNIPRSPSINVDIMGAKILMKHGDNVRMGGTSPFYGLARDTAQEHQKRRGERDFDYILQGHLHDFDIVERRILAPSLIGTNEWAFNRLHAMPEPSQLMMFLTKQHKITTYWPLFLSEAQGNGFQAI